MTKIPSTRERPTRPPARAPVRRLSGLEHLSRRGRISRSQRAAGEAYGSVWRRSQSEGGLPSLAQVERAHIARVLEAVDWNKKEGARMLDVSRGTLYRKIQEYQLEPPRRGSISGGGQSGL